MICPPVMVAPPPIKFPSLLVVEDDASTFRSDMLRFARLQLRDDFLAEEAVQESLVLAWEKRGQFKNRSQLKTWVFSILKNKIIDIMRSRARSPVLVIDVDEIPESAGDAMFDEDGNWRDDARPSNWGDPEQCLSDRQFFRVLEVCLERLPDNAARVFMMREILGFEVNEICKELSISVSNCSVILHRARIILRMCLTDRWFNSGRPHDEL